MSDEPERGARLNIVIEPAAGEFHMKMTSSVEGDEGFEGQIYARSQGSFADSGARLRVFKDLVEHVQVDDWPRSGARSGSALRNLLRTGNLFAYLLLGREGLDRFRRHLKLLFADYNRQDEPTRIEIAAPDDLWFPLELMPVLTDLPADPVTVEDVFAALDAFPGFAAIVRRTALGPPLAQRTKLVMREHLPMRLFRYGSLESELFDQAARPFDIHGSWPERAYRQAEGVTAFGRLVFDAAALGDAEAEQVQHFACHCQTDTGQAGSWEIQLAPPRGNDDVRLRLDELLYELNRRVRDASITRPLVFMNACGSAVIDPFSIASLPRLFLDNFNCTYIGTETRISPAVAAFISNRFYAHFLRPRQPRSARKPHADTVGDSAGMALHRAKWDLLVQHGNPCGVLYTIYGDTDAVVVNKRGESGV